MPLVNVGDIDIYYEEQGRGEPVLLAQPSWWPCDTWKVAVAPSLASRYRIILFDPRGTGYSGKPERGYTIEQFALDALALLRQLEIRRCHAVGFALGAQIVQALALARPAMVATLTMAGVGAGARSTNGGLRGDGGDEESEIREHGFERFIRGHVENTDMAFGAEFYRDHFDVVKALSQALWERQTSPEQFRHHSAARRTWDTLGNAGRLAVPTLVLCGAEDEVNRGGSTPLGTARKLAEVVSGAELVLVPGVKHMTFWDGGGALAALRDFLARHPIAEN